MSSAVHVHRLSPLGTDEWRVVRDVGFPPDIRLQISSMLNGSRYFVISPHGEIMRGGTFNFGVWDPKEMAEVLAAIVAAVRPGSEVHVDLSLPRRMAGGYRLVRWTHDEGPDRFSSIVAVRHALRAGGPQCAGARRRHELRADERRREKPCPWAT